MFTGIVAAVGTVASTETHAESRRIQIDAPASFLAGVKHGDSIAIDGVCLTVVHHGAAGFTADVIGTTLSRTTMGALTTGSRVNLELALAMGDRLGGHIVQGHVDGVGRVLSIARSAEHVLLDVSLPADVADVTVLHGSITINGVSLTVNALPSTEAAQVALIPYTWDNTNLSALAVGSAVNLEGDMLGRFVVHYLARRGGA